MKKNSSRCGKIRRKSLVSLIIREKNYVSLLNVDLKSCFAYFFTCLTHCTLLHTINSRVS